MTSDGDLLEAWRAGDDAAGRALVDRYYDRVFGFFASKLNEQVGDLVQDTFLACVKGKDRIRDGEGFRSYLFAIAFNVLKGHLRHRLRHPGDLTSRSIEDLAPGPSTVLRQSENKQRLLSALRKIPLQLQIVLELLYWEGMTAAEIAQILNIPAATVRSHHRRAKRLLKEALRSEPSAWKAVEDTIQALDAEVDRRLEQQGPDVGLDDKPPRGSPRVFSME